MKLLPQTEVKAMKKKSLDEAMALKTKLVNEIDAKTKALNDLKVEVQEVTQRTNNEFVAFCRDCENKKLALVNEIASLEAQKRDMFVPIRVSEDRVKQRELQVSKHERDQQKEWTALFQKQSHLTIVEEQLRSAEKQYFLKTDELRAYQREIETRDEALKEQEQKFNARLVEANKDYEARFATINEAIVVTKTKQAEYESLKAELDKEKSWLADERKHLDSQRHSLQRAYDNAKKKKIL